MTVMRLLPELSAHEQMAGRPKAERKLRFQTLFLLGYGVATDQIGRLGWPTDGVALMEFCRIANTSRLIDLAIDSFIMNNPSARKKFVSTMDGVLTPRQIRILFASCIAHQVTREQAMAIALENRQRMQARTQCKDTIWCWTEGVRLMLRDPPRHRERAENAVQIILDRVSPRHAREIIEAAAVAKDVRDIARYAVRAAGGRAQELKTGSASQSKPFVYA